jgi:hypothetical protein
MTGQHHPSFMNSSDNLMPILAIKKFCLARPYVYLDWFPGNGLM